jgi:hypothetical protein
MRTLLPVFKALVRTYNKEEPETFDWLPRDIRQDYVLAKEALDRIPGSREWLKSYTFESEGMPFCSPMGNQIMSAFGSHHSGSSATRLGWNYKFLLNNWDSFVLNSKESLAREEYDAKQLTSTDMQTFLRLKYEWQEGKLIREVERLRGFFNIHHDYETTYTMLLELAEEKSKEAAAQEEKAKREYFEDRISVLEHHYKYPSRWYDSEWGSSLFGSVKNISPEMMEEMERRYPGYKEHIASLTVS